jgi:hypothetical protein
MSRAAEPLRSPGVNGGGGAGPLFRHQVRREGRIVVALECTRQDDGSVVVETTVTPPGRKAGEAISRPFAFPQVDTARRFVDETIVALEYLGCDIVEA